MITQYIIHTGHIIQSGVYISIKIHCSLPPPTSKPIFVSWYTKSKFAGACNIDWLKMKINDWNKCSLWKKKDLLPSILSFVYYLSISTLSIIIFYFLFAFYTLLRIFSPFFLIQLMDPFINKKLKDPLRRSLKIHYFSQIFLRIFFFSPQPYPGTAIFTSLSLFKSASLSVSESV